MNTYPELTRSREDMLSQNELYKPSRFWDEASQQIVKELTTFGIDRFRSLPTTLGYFVPTYGFPGNCFSQEMIEGINSRFKNEFPLEKKPQISIEQFLTGKMSAISDYRVLVAADNQSNLPYLHTFSESSFGEPIEQFEFEGRKYSRSSLNYLLGLAMLKKHLNGSVPKTVLEIGGGFGTLGEILSSSGIEELRYIDIDIPPTSYVAQVYLSNVLGKNNVATYEQTREKTLINIDSLPQASVFCSWQIEKLVGKVDLFVNFISFQEMEPHIVKNYLEHVARLETKWVLLRNMKEGKNKRKDKDSAGVETPILGDDYKTMLTDYELVDRNVIPFGYRTVDDFNSELLLFRRK
ncbi:MAG: putative sugar O-methyltransferase [Bacteroidia bacterium]|nr:putative sugar O-methyltransferase [Bacteroidia bacterium]